MTNPVGYLYRVGQSASRRYTSDRVPIDRSTQEHSAQRDLEPRLASALDSLTEQQRTVALLVHGFHWKKSEVASHLDIAESTVGTHLERAMTNIRNYLEIEHDQ